MINELGGLEDREIEEARMPPEGDQSIALEAAAIHNSISLHAPFDVADWTDFEAMLPEAAIRPSAAEELSKENPLIRLAKDNSIWVRCTVAANPSAPSNVLDELASDPSQEVRSHAGGNPSTPVHALARLANDPVPVVRASVKANPSAQNGVTDKGEKPRGSRSLRDGGKTKVPQAQVEKFADQGTSNSNRHKVGTPLRETSVTRRYEHGFAAPLVNRLKPDDDIDQLIGRLIAICKTGADFLKAEDANRYVHFLRNLSAFRMPTYLQNATGIRSTARTGKLPIRDLRHVIEPWVMSYFSDRKPLMPHFALDSAEFIRRMMRGCWEESADGLRIEPVMDGTYEEHSNFDLEFQREFRRKLNPTTRGVIPRNAEFVWLLRANGQSIAPDYLPAGSVFAFDVTECHLAETLTEMPRIAMRDEQGNSRPDICRDFQLHGVVRPLSSSPTLFGQFLEQKGSGQFVRLPFRWITDAVVLNPNGKSASLLPIATWIDEATIRRSAEKHSIGGDSFPDKDSKKKTNKKSKVSVSRKSPPRPSVQLRSEDFLPRHKWRQPDVAELPQKQNFVSAKSPAGTQAGSQPRREPKLKLTPKLALCFKCGKPLKSCMLIWPAERRFCKPCKRS
jgi:hypothetical protein